MATYDKPAFERMMIFEEGCKLKPYRDTKDILTIGIGRNLDANGIRGGEATLMFWNDVADCERALDRYIPWWRELSDARQQALLCMVFQLGPDGFMEFKKMIASLQLGDFRAAAANALDSKWARDDTPERAKRMATMIERG